MLCTTPPGSNITPELQIDHWHRTCLFTRIARMLNSVGVPDSKVHGANMGPPGSCWPQMGPLLAASGVLSVRPLHAWFQWWQWWRWWSWWGWWWWLWWWWFSVMILTMIVMPIMMTITVIWWYRYCQCCWLWNHGIWLASHNDFLSIVPDGTNPLPEPKSIYHQRRRVVHFHKKKARIISNICLEITSFFLNYNPSKDQWINITGPISSEGHRTRVAAVTLDNMAERVSAQREDLP